MRNTDSKPKSDKLKVIHFIMKYSQYVVLIPLLGLALNLVVTFLILTPGQVEQSILISFVQHNQVIATVLLFAFGLLLILDYAIMRPSRTQKSNSLRLRSLSNDRDFPYNSLRNRHFESKVYRPSGEENDRDFVTGKPIRRVTSNLFTETSIDNKFQVELVKAWIQNDTKLKQDLRSLFVADDKIGNSVQSEEIGTIQRLEDRLILLEKQLLEERAKKKSWYNKLPDWASTIYNIAYVFVAIPTLATLIYELYKFLHP